MSAINEANKTEIIDLYLHGLLERELLEEFNERLATDEKFRNEVELQQSILNNITHVGRNKLKDQLRQIHQDEVAGRDIEDSVIGELTSTSKKGDQKKHDKFFEKKYLAWKVAAVISFLLMMAFAGYYSAVSSEKVFSGEFQPYKMSSLRGSDNGSNNTLSLYESGDYQKYIGSYEANSVNTTQATFLAGNAYLTLSQPGKAMRCFKNVMSANEKLVPEDRRFFEDAEYFLALAYLKNDQPAEAEKIFQSINRTPGHTYHHKVGTGLLLKMKLLRFKH